MTDPHRAVISRLSADFAAMSAQLARVSYDLVELDRLLAQRPPAPQPVVPYWPAQHVPPVPPPPPPPQARAPRPPRDAGWIGKALAVAGVAVTLIGLVLLGMGAGYARLLAQQDQHRV